MKRLALLLIGAAVATSSAAASTGVVLASRDIALKPSGIHLRLVASKTNLDQKRTGRVALWLTSYKKAGPGWRKIKQLKVTTGFKLSSRLVSLKVVQLSGPEYKDTAEVHLRWFITPSIGARTYSFVATPKLLAPQN